MSVIVCVVSTHAMTAARLNYLPTKAEASDARP